MVRQHLGTKRAGRWLFIIDNADDSEMWFSKLENSAGSLRLFDYLPNSNQGSIFITSRNRQLAFNMVQEKIVEVKHMDLDTAKDLLHKALVKTESLKD